eukprot:748852-Hanusia_phi.AAC.3
MERKATLSLLRKIKLAGGQEAEQDVSEEAAVPEERRRKSQGQHACQWGTWFESEALEKEVATLCSSSC